MLSSITPLGQRGRGMSWGRTVLAFWVGAVAAGSLVFGTAGLLGELLGATDISVPGLLIVVLAAAALDLARIGAPGPRRQVDEDWLGRYRDWVTGLGYGFQLGSGFSTIVPSWGSWALLAIATLEGVPVAALIGVGFGIGRSLLLVATRNVLTTGRLATVMQGFVRAESRARRMSLTAYGLSAILVGLYVF